MKQLSCAALALALSAPALAQTYAVDGAGPLGQAIGAWHSSHGSTWRLRVDEETGFGRLLYNGRLEPAFAPSSDADYFELADQAIAASDDLFGIGAETLVRDKALFLPLGNANSTDKLSVQYRQVVNGVPVQRGFVSVLFDTRGRMLSIDTTGLPGLADFDTTPTLGADAALRLASAHFAADSGTPIARRGQAELVIQPLLDAGRRLPLLAWRVSVLGRADGGQPDGYVYAIDAHSGRLVARDELVHNFDVSGSVMSMVSPGELPDVSYNPEAPEAAASVQVMSAQGNAVTGLDGSFNIVGASAPLAVTLRYVGPFALVENRAGASLVENDSANSSSGNNFVMNNAMTEFTTAEANLFNWINGFRNWVRNVNPADATGDFQAVGGANNSGACNAFYTGSSIEHLRAGTCVNMGYSSIVLHEMGHWYNDLYGSGNGSDGFGEGNADAVSFFILNSPITGRDIVGPGTLGRTGENTRQFCGDGNPGCHGGVHANGEVLMGALWKVHRNLQATHGDSAGSLIADTLYNSWMNAYNDGQIRTIIEEHWLILDDDDGFLGNGTPNFSDIDGAFMEQGFPGLPCGGSASFCVISPNSAGAGAFLMTTGTTSVAANDLVLHASAAPAGRPGLFFYGSLAVQVPFGDGFRCVGGDVARLYPTLTTDGFGGVSRPLDLSAPPASSGPREITVGSTWHFQFWFRDPSGPGGSGFNLTDGIVAQFCP